ncbi:uncharacterized protein [Physcomitrium patens]|nr:uncharacterized protein LOC112291265 isoform X2 [Physcomitrium patens]PNR41295.1 hypothetical protein PHYPA_018698 [Physcomitrium patens]|eukprot:XP_024394195.1 uncharacterized protein LOC112291265 isoform X2 [Physcomitrella patens]
MERALLERCPNNLLRRRAAENYKVQPKNVSELALVNFGRRPISTSAAHISRAAYCPPTYTSLAEIIPTPGSSMVERIDSPRTPMRNRLVEKAARAYLLHTDSLDKRHRESTPWTQSFSRFLPRLSTLTSVATSLALNPFNVFNSAFQVFRFYVTGVRALQPQLSASVSRSVCRSASTHVRRTSYARELKML